MPATREVGPRQLQKAFLFLGLGVSETSRERLLPHEMPAMELSFLGSCGYVMLLAADWPA